MKPSKPAVSRDHRLQVCGSGQGGAYRIARSTWLMSVKAAVFRVTRMNP
jgi:hypothetical protein